MFKVNSNYIYFLYLYIIYLLIQEIRRLEKLETELEFFKYLQKKILWFLLVCGGKREAKLMKAKEYCGQQLSECVCVGVHSYEQ